MTKTTVKLTLVMGHWPWLLHQVTRLMVVNLVGQRH